MCCRLEVTPLNREVAEAILAIGQFVYQPRIAAWVREIAEEHSYVRATFNTADAMRLSIEPSITAFVHHFTKRITAGVYFEIACKYAEKVGGTITQLSNVSGCAENGLQTHLLAVYPGQPMMWEAVCAGFQETLAGHHIEPEPEEPIAY